MVWAKPRRLVIVLGIETSCDETGIAVYKADEGVVAENLYSQVELHAEYGGVVPELASRDHIRKTLPLIRETLREAKLDITSIDGVAFTSGPGLIGALMVGATIGRSLAWALGVPAVGVHHMEAHLLAALLEHDDLGYPFVALLVSGGHTMLVEVRQAGDYKLLGESLDDAVGEAFDKTAKLLGLGYPGGPEISRLARSGDANRFAFPRPMVDRANLDMSFSGLKTAVQTAVKKLDSISEQDRADVAASFEAAAVDTLKLKCGRAMSVTRYDCLVLAGGVAANRRLRSEMQELPCRVVYPSLNLCTDNGAMIAFVGHERLANGQRDPLSVTTKARWDIQSI